MLDDYEQILQYADADKLSKELDESKMLRETIFGLIYVGIPGKHTPTKCAAKILFREYFWRPFSKIHDAIFAVLDGCSQHFVIFAPRGVGKTTTTYIAYAGRKILTREMKFFVPISDSNDNAIKRANNLRYELMNNEIIAKVFGPIKSVEESFSSKEWTTATGTHVYPRGRSQNIRGSLHKRFRVDHPFGDDIEDDEMVRSEVRRNDLHDWWLGHVSNTVDRGADDWRIGLIGTMLHEDCLLMRMADDPAYEVVNLSICTEQYKSNWPEFMSDKDIGILVSRFKAHGKLDVFYREYMNIAAATEDASFKQKHFQDYHEGSQEFQDEIPEIEDIVLGDPAKTAKMQSADSALVGMGINLKRRKLYVRSCIRGKMYPDEFVTAAIDLGLRFRTGGGFCRILGIETVTLEDWIVQLFRKHLATRGVNFRLEELRGQGARGNVEAKDARIGAMSDYYRDGWIYHNPTCCAPLEQQLLSFPRSKLRDLMDAESNFIYLMEQGKLMFNTDEQYLDDLNRDMDGEFDESTMYDEEDIAQLKEIGGVEWRLFN
jgi:hypothetical protein